MATHHAAPGELVDLHTWAKDLPVEVSKVIAKINGVELARLVLADGSRIPKNDYSKIGGPLVVHCIEGLIEIDYAGKLTRLSAGQLVYLEANSAHALRGIQESVVLLTFILR